MAYESTFPILAGRHTNLCILYFIRNFGSLRLLCSVHLLCLPLIDLISHFYEALLLLGFGLNLIDLQRLASLDHRHLDIVPALLPVLLVVVNNDLLLSGRRRLPNMRIALKAEDLTIVVVPKL